MKRLYLLLACTSFALTGCLKSTYVSSNLEKEPEKVLAADENTDEGNETEAPVETDENKADSADITEETDTETDKTDEVEEPMTAETVTQTEQSEAQKTPPVQPEVTSSAVGYNDSKSWWFRRNNEHIPPTAQQDINITGYDAYYIGDTSQKVIYLTFDEGYEAGYSSKILDVLKDNDVKATFFVTGHYLESQPDLVKRMADEGHIVGNHSYKHLDHTQVSDEEMIEDITSCYDLITETTGVEMPKFFRPPAGVYSVRTLEIAQKLGYKTIFWSFAYKDWDTQNQPSSGEAYNMVMDNYHNGCIMLLHAVSEANTNALDDIIKSLKNEGYEFKLLTELP